MPRMASVGHRLGIGDPQERVEQGAVATRALDGGAPGRARHRDVDVVVALHGRLGRVPGIVGPREADEEEERLLAVVALDPLHGLLAVPGVDIGLERAAAWASSPTSARTWSRSARPRSRPGSCGRRCASCRRRAGSRAGQVVGVAARDLARRTCRPSRRPPRSPAPRAARPCRRCATPRGGRRGRDAPCPGATCDSRPLGVPTHRSGCRRGSRPSWCRRRGRGRSALS